MKITGIVRHSFVDGPGVRYVVFFQGCTHNCKNCQNPDTHDINQGEYIESSDVISDIIKQKFLDGITLSGGDPFMQPSDLCDIAMGIKLYTDLSVWCYTGYTFEQLLESEDPVIQQALKYIDVLVDGPFIEELKSDNCIFRGSTNQRLIDVQESLKLRKVILYNYNERE